MPRGNDCEAQSPQLSCRGSRRRRGRRRHSGQGRNCRARRTAAGYPRRCRRMPMSPPPRPARRRCRTPENGTPGSDFMVDVIKTLDIKYLPANPASSYRGLHKSLIDYGKNTMPEFLTCMHEESAVAHVPRLLQGDRQADDDAGPRRGRPAARHHGDLQRLVRPRPGDHHRRQRSRRRASRAGRADLPFRARTSTRIVRDYTKWDDTPVSAQHFAQVVRAHVQDRDDAALRPGDDVARRRLAERSRSATTANRSTSRNSSPTAPPQGDDAAVKEAARLLANAERPVIVVDRAARTANGVKLLVELAELLQAPVVDQGGRMNFPNTHYLSQPPGDRDRPSRRRHRHGAVGLLGDGERLRRQRQRRLRSEHQQDQAGDQADQHQLGRSAHQVELPGLPALPEHRHFECRAMPRRRCRR